MGDKELAEAAVRRAYLADGALVIITLIWGSTFITVKGAIQGVGPFEFLALRFGIACLALFVLFHGRLGRLGPSGLRGGAIIGVCLFVGYALQTVGLQHTTASRSAFITGLAVLVVPLLAFALLRQRIGTGVALGVVLATVGLWLLSSDGEMAFGQGELLTIVGAVAFAAHIVAIGAYAPRFDPIGLAIVQTGVTAALSAPFCLGLEWPPVVPTQEVWLAIAFTGLVASAFVLGAQTSIQRFTTPSHAALIFSLEPVFAGLFAYFLGGELLGASGILGGALIVGGMVVAELRRN